MQDRPDTATLLDAVAALLRDEIVPALDGATAYQARIAASLVAIVAREQRLGPASDAAERDRLQALLGSATDDLAALNGALAERLRDCTLSLYDPAVAAHLRATTMAKLAIDQPRYPRYNVLREKDQP